MRSGTNNRQLLQWSAIQRYLEIATKSQQVKGCRPLNIGDGLVELVAELELLQ